VPSAAAYATGTETIPRNNDFAPKVWVDPNDVWCSKCRGVGHFRDGCNVTGGSLPPVSRRNRAQHFGGADERKPSTRCAGELEKLRAQITEQETTAQGLRIELATLRGHANEEFAAIRSEIEAVRNGIADAVATVVQSETQKILEDERNGREEQQRYLDKIMGGLRDQIATRYVSGLSPFSVGLEDTGSVC
ncbi:hypothetical protein BJ742DRAFT_798344, partial [Cladochytrium replicatum]